MDGWNISRYVYLVLVWVSGLALNGLFILFILFMSLGVLVDTLLPLLLCPLLYYLGAYRKMQEVVLIILTRIMHPVKMG